jgi:hypothetical protein
VGVRDNRCSGRCGHGLLDLQAYDSYLQGDLVDEDVTDARPAEGLATLP